MKRLSDYFPAGPATQQHVRRPGNRIPAERRHEGKQELDHMSTKWRTILSLELQGLPKNQIAQMIGYSEVGISNITRDPRYREYRDQYLATLDSDFFAMKPLAFAALRNGLSSTDEDTALKASDQWFRAASFGGYSKRETPDTTLTAEDVVKQLLQVNVQVNVSGD